MNPRRKHGAYYWIRCPRHQAWEPAQWLRQEYWDPAGWYTCGSEIRQDPRSVKRWKRLIPPKEPRKGRA